MNIFTSLFLTTALVGCTTNPQVRHIQSTAIQTFGSDTNLMIHEVIVLKPLEFTVSGPYRTEVIGERMSDELSLRSDMQLGSIQNVDLVVWGASSTWTASALLSALYYAGAHRLSHLRVLFVGDPQDAERIRLAVEATGAQFYFHQMIYNPQ